MLRGSGANSGMVAKVAIKTLKSETSAEAFLDEALTMIELRHKNVVQIYGVRGIPG